MCDNWTKLNKNERSCYPCSVYTLSTHTNPFAYTDSDDAADGAHHFTHFEAVQNWLGEMTNSPLLWQQTYNELYFKKKE